MAKFLSALRATLRIGALLALIAAAIAMALPDLLDRTYLGAFLSGACRQSTPPKECSPVGF